MPRPTTPEAMAQLRATLRKSELFIDLADEEIDSIIALSREVAYKAGEEIFDQDSEGTELYIMPQGRVSIELKIADDAVTERIYQAKDNEVFGELALLDGHRRSAKIRALENLTLLVISRKDLFNLMEENCHLGYHMMFNLSRILARKIRDTNMALRNALMEHKHILNLLQ